VNHYSLTLIFRILNPIPTDADITGRIDRILQKYKNEHTDVSDDNILVSVEKDKITEHYKKLMTREHWITDLKQYCELRKLKKNDCLKKYYDMVEKTNGDLGYYVKSNGKFDWAVVGGKYNNLLRLKRRIHFSKYMHGINNAINESENVAIDGLVDCANINDIDWVETKNVLKTNAVLDLTQTWFDVDYRYQGEDWNFYEEYIKKLIKKGNENVFVAIIDCCE